DLLPADYGTCHLITARSSASRLHRGLRMTSHLLTYMNDHVAGSRSALELLDYLIDAHPDMESRSFFTTLRADVAADRKILDAAIAKLGGTPSPWREASGWFADRLTRLKLTIDDPGGGGLKHLEALE